MTVLFLRSWVPLSPFNALQFRGDLQGCASSFDSSNGLSFVGGVSGNFPGISWLEVELGVDATTGVPVSTDGIAGGASPAGISM